MHASRSRILSTATNVDPKGMEARFSVEWPREVESRNLESFARRGSLVKVDENDCWVFRVTRMCGLAVCCKGKCCDGCSGLAIGRATAGFFRTPRVRVMRLVTVAARISCVTLRCWWIGADGGGLERRITGSLRR